LESSSSSENEGEGEEFEDEPSASDSADREIDYMVGDVTHPQNTGLRCYCGPLRR